MTERRLRLPNQFLQSLVVGVVSFAATLVAWYVLWPYPSRTVSAVSAAGVVAVFCAVASWMRSHDDDWEREHLRTRPILSPRRIRDDRAAKRQARPDADARKAEKERRKAEKAAEKERRKAEKAQPVPGFEELANLKGRTGEPVTIPGAEAASTDAGDASPSDD